MSSTKYVTSYLLQLGFDRDEINVFLALQRYGAMTISELSKRSQVERTALYRMLDLLVDKQLIYIEEEHKRKIIYPAKASTITRLAERKHLQSQHLIDEKDGFLADIKQLNGTSTSTHVQHYRGVEALKQIQWNMLRNSNSTLYTVSTSVFEEYLQEEFFDNWARQHAKAKLRSEVVYSEAFKASIVRNREHLSSRSYPSIVYHYLPPALLPISKHMEVHDNKTVYYSLVDDIPEAVEIDNQQIADMNRQHIQLLISQASSPQGWQAVLNTTDADLEGAQA